MKRPERIVPAVPEDLAEHFQLFRDYVKHEDELINRRLTWLLTVQGFLFAAYGIANQIYAGSNSKNGSETLAMRNFAERLGSVFASVGLVVGALAFLGVLAAQFSVWSLEKQWKNIPKPNAAEAASLPGLTGAGNIMAKVLGAIAHNFIPIMIIGAWGWIIRIHP
jgi:hypothetical protein